jgi:recombination protein RecT
MAPKNQTENKNPKESKQQTVALEPVSSRFVAQIQRQFTAEIGNPMAFTVYEKTLAQHLFLKIDATLKELEAKRTDVNKPAYSWENVNMQKLALDAVHRVNLGLDALITGHIYPIPYFNSKTKKYDLDLRIGYIGKDYYRRQNAVEMPIDVRYELVRKNDVFKPIMKSFKNPIESYEFEIANPFDRGEVIGGFGYIMYEDPKKNKLVIVTEKDFKKSENSAQSKDFWGKHPDEMKYKTLVNRVTDKMPLDPKSVNAASYAYVEAQENDAEARVEAEIKANANKEMLDIKDAVDADYIPAEPAVEAELTKEEKKTTGKAKEKEKEKDDVQQIPLSEEVPY